jgi:hypothetical protein
MRFAVTLPTPPDYPHAEAVREVAESLYHALVAVGHDSILTARTHCRGRRHVILCPHLLPHLDTPPAADAVLYNLEQIGPGGASLHPQLLDLFRRHAVWDYSQRNIQEGARLGVHGVRHLPVGYVPQLARIARDEEDIDVLFCGSMNERRPDVLDALRRRGVRPEVVFGVYGSARDRLIARARVVLNMHYHESKVFEVVRVSYLLANERFVVCERGSHRPEEEEFAAGVAFADYGDLVQVCVDYLARPGERRRIARAGFELMRRRDLRDYVRRVLDDATSDNECHPTSGLHQD